MVVTYEIQPGEGLDQFRLGEALARLLSVMSDLVRRFAEEGARLAGR